MKRVAILLLVLVLAVGGSGCNLPNPASVSSTPPSGEDPSVKRTEPKPGGESSETTPLATIQESILGKWEPLNSRERYEFLKDGQMRLTQGNTPPLEGTYKVTQEGMLDLNYSGIAFRVKCRLQRDELTLTYTDDNKELKFKRGK